MATHKSSSSNQAGKQTERLANTMRLIQERESAKKEKPKTAINSQHRALALLLDDLGDVINELGEASDYFNFHLTNGDVPQLWVDDTTFVVMARNEEGFRLLKETRAGRVLLRESRERKMMGEEVVHYVAERLSQIERESAQSYSEPIREMARPKREELITAMDIPEPQIIVRGSGLRSFAWFLTGVITGAALLLAVAWFHDEISAYLAVF